MMHRYAPEFFNRTTFESAQSVSLTPGGGMGTAERWEKETAWLAKRIFFPGGDLVIDYGCGTGRVSKLFNRPVIGVDISPTMRSYALEYVNRTTFATVTPQCFRAMVAAGMRADGAMAIWAFQHVDEIEATVHVLMTGIKPKGLFWLLDLCERNVPALDKDGKLIMINDRKDMLSMLESWCDLEKEEKLDIWPEEPANGGYLRRFRRRH